ncbi:MAG: hypothetical protein U1E19_09185 [Rhodoblastus sp.]
MIAKRLLLAASAVALASASALAQSPALTGLDAWKAVVGNTIVGKTPTGEALVEYFAANGVAKNRIAGKPGEGEWSLRGAKVCTDYADDDEEEGGDGKEDEDSSDDEEADCYSLSVQGDALTLTDEAGKAREFKILPGNAEKL